MRISRRQFLLSSGGAALAAAATISAYQLRITNPSEMPTTATEIISQTESEKGRFEFHVETFLGNLTIPWSLAFAPDGRAFFTERPGRINVLALGSSNRTIFAEIAVAHVGEGGLLGLALSPDFEVDRFVYVYHSYREGTEILNRVIQYRDKEGAGVNPQVILDKIPGASIHDGGRIRFGPDGKLYVATGDGSVGSRAQDVQSLAGKILRLNPDGTIPSDNPLPNSPVYSLGHRNPQGIDWNPVNGRLYETEHGPSGEGGRFANDEINLIQSGKNYGWPLAVGESNDPSFVNPVLYTGDNETWAPSGCSFYKGSLLSEWKNSFFVATLRGLHLHRFLFDAQTGEIKVNEKLLAGGLGRLRDVVEGPDGLLYILTSNRDGRGSPAPNDDRILRLMPV